MTGYNEPGTNDLARNPSIFSYNTDKPCCHDLGVRCGYTVP